MQQKVQRTKREKQPDRQHGERRLAAHVPVVERRRHVTIEEVDEQLLILRLASFHVRGKIVERQLICVLAQRFQNACPRLIHALEREIKLCPMYKRDVRHVRTAGRQNLFHPLIDRFLAVLCDGEKMVAQREQRRFLFVELPLARHDERCLLRPGQNEARGLLAAEANANLRALRKKAAVARVVGANLAEHTLPAV